MQPATIRDVSLVELAGELRRTVRARLYRNYPPAALVDAEDAWSDVRVEIAVQAESFGVLSLEHAHWNWRNKAENVKDDEYLLIGVECAEEPQGLMAVSRRPRPAKSGGWPIVYVDYVETAPWNLRTPFRQPRYLGVGTVLLAEAVRLSGESGFGGAIGLHALPQAERFYSDKMGMKRFGSDPDYYDLAYYEFDGPSAVQWLQSIGETMSW